MPAVLKEKVISVQKLAPDIYKIKFQSEYIADNARPGQFINVKCQDGYNALLRRPISICDVNEDNKTVDIVFRQKGVGTEILTRIQPGSLIDIIGPLGNPFDHQLFAKTMAVVGGGIGVFPLIYLLKKSVAQKKIAYLSYKNSQQIVLMDLFNKYCDEVVIATEDGSFGEKGFVVDIAKDQWVARNIEIAYTCGPKPMMKKIAEISDEHKTICQVSMEQRMGCGIGACLVCACKTKLGDEWEYSHVCSDGPVFISKDIIWED